jgi:hypothetical protein
LFLVDPFRGGAIEMTDGAFIYNIPAYSRVDYSTHVEPVSYRRLVLKDDTLFVQEISKERMKIYEEIKSKDFFAYDLSEKFEINRATSIFVYREPFSVFLRDRTHSALLVFDAGQNCIEIPRNIMGQFTDFVGKKTVKFQFENQYYETFIRRLLHTVNRVNPDCIFVAGKPPNTAKVSSDMSGSTFGCLGLLLAPFAFTLSSDLGLVAAILALAILIGDYVISKNTPDKKPPDYAKEKKNSFEPRLVAQHPMVFSIEKIPAWIFEES